MANNGERGWSLARDPYFSGPAGSLAEHAGKDWKADWKVIERKPFCEVTGPGGLAGNGTRTGYGPLAGTNAPSSLTNAVKSPASRGAVGWSRSAVVIDIGGGSTELIFTRPGDGIREVSLPLGAVYLTERFLKNDPPAAEDLERLRRSIRFELGLHGWLKFASSDALIIGTAGTITTLASMDMQLAAYDPDRINGYVQSRESIRHLADRLSVTVIKERPGLPGLESGREDIILAGAIVCMEIMELFGSNEMIVSDWGLREGIILRFSYL